MKEFLRNMRRNFFWWRKKKLGMKYRPEYKKFDIGEYTYGAPVIHDYNEKLTIGRYCSIGPEVMILLGGSHRMDWVTTYPFSALFSEFTYLGGHPISKGPIIIGNDVWIAARATILSGIKIGNGAVIAAGSVVTKDIPPYAIVAGNPAKVIKMRFDDETIEKLQATKWWEKSFEELKPYIPSLQNPDIKTFLEKFSGR